MKILNKIIIAVALAVAAGCTDVVKIDVDHVGGYATADDEKSEAYYASLRRFKAEAVNYARPVSFGWFSDWNPTGSYRKNYLAAVPDSMDIISMWGKPQDLTPEQVADKEFVRQVKGTKVTVTLLLSQLGKGYTPASVSEEVYKRQTEAEAAGEPWDDATLSRELKEARWKYWGLESLDPNNQEEMNAALKKYARAIYETNLEEGFDGLDIDWEPGTGFNDDDMTLTINNNIVLLVKYLGEYMGPMSDPEGKGHMLLMVDGSNSVFEQNCPEYIDYFIKQSYNGGGTIDSSYPYKYILCENFEKNAVDGGAIMTYASYNPATATGWQTSTGIPDHLRYKGGFGAYRFTKDYDNNPPYKWMLAAIQENIRSFEEFREMYPVPEEENNE